MTNVSINDLELILTGARAIQDSDGFRKQLETTDLSELDNLQGIYGIAEQYGISQESVDKYLALRFPSEERQLKTMEELGNNPSQNALERFYTKTLLEELKKKFPSEKFEWYYNEEKGQERTLGKVHQRKTIRFEKISLFREKAIPCEIKEHEPYASLEFYVDDWFQLKIYNPSFAEACKDKLVEFKKRFSHLFKKGQYEMIVDYLDS